MFDPQFHKLFRLMFTTPEGDGGSDGEAKGSDLGFPADTPAKDMTPEQQAAYYKHLAKKHEKNAKALLKNARPDNFDQILADAEAYRRQQDEAKPAEQRAIDAARAEALAAARKEADDKYLPVLVRAEFARRLPHMDEAELDELLEDVTPQTYFKDGEVDKERVDRMAARFAPKPAEEQPPAGFTLADILGKTTPPGKGALSPIAEAEQRTLAKYQSQTPSK